MEQPNTTNPRNTVAEFCHVLDRLPLTWLEEEHRKINTLIQEIDSLSATAEERTEKHRELFHTTNLFRKERRRVCDDTLTSLCAQEAPLLGQIRKDTTLYSAAVNMQALIFRMDKDLNYLNALWQELEQEKKSALRKVREDAEGISQCIKNLCCVTRTYRQNKSPH